ncbi:MAG: GNAT family N-acetyltransferase [Acidimicrobiales bacterium]
MTSPEFDVFRSRLIESYAADHVRAGNWNADEAGERSASEIEQLLPEGAKTPGMLILTAETSEGDVVGHLWVALELRPGSGGGAWIYDIEIAAQYRGRGYGRALLRAGETECAQSGVSVLGLNVFGANAVARHLYESAGYEVTSVQMRKRLTP